MKTKGILSNSDEWKANNIRAHIDAEIALIKKGINTEIDWSFLDQFRNQPSPYQPGQKSPTAYLEEAWKNDSKDEMSIAVRALTAQAQAHAEELEAVCNWTQEENWRLKVSGYWQQDKSHRAGIDFSELLQIFRASRSGKQTEG